jgi:hypothetical protein
MAKTEKEMGTAETGRETKGAEGEKMVKIKLPRTRKDEPDEFVSVNERTWLIKRGVEVEVPECVAEVLRHKEEMEEAAYQFDQSVQN